jgi:hypothetical protein
MIKYKLTTQDLITYRYCNWEIGKTNKTTGQPDYLCSSGYLHFYHHPLLSVFLNPIHANIDNPRLFEAEVDGKLLDDFGTKGGCTEMTLVKELEFPNFELKHKFKTAIACASELLGNQELKNDFIEWLNDRTKDVFTYHINDYKHNDFTKKTHLFYYMNMASHEFNSYEKMQSPTLKENHLKSCEAYIANIVEQCIKGSDISSIIKILEDETNIK